MVRALLVSSVVSVAVADFNVTLMDGSQVSVAGVEVSASCPGRDGAACSLDGSSNYHSGTIKLNTATGIFCGTLTTNQCSNDHYGYCALCDPPAFTTHTHSARCISVTFPSHTGPALAPLRGPVGYTKYGVNIFGPEEAGFGTGNFPKPCKDGSGTCPAGMDVPTCEANLEYVCGETGSKPVHELMLDSCGGHAMPYHYHNDDACDYDHTAAGHSPLIGWGLDGVGIYGLYENNPTKPKLDACNGHVDEVPADNEYGVPSGTVMYHYHVTNSAPYTLGCYGNAGLSSKPVSQDECKTFYSKCGSGYSQVNINNEKYCYDLDCPCFDGRSDRLGRNTDVTSCSSVHAVV